MSSAEEKQTNKSRLNKNERNVYKKKEETMSLKVQSKCQEKMFISQYLVTYFTHTFCRLR